MGLHFVTLVGVFVGLPPGGFLQSIGDSLSRNLHE